MSYQIFYFMYSIWKIWYMDHYKAFFVIPPVCSIPEGTRNEFFDWYLAGIEHDGVCKPYIFAVKSKQNEQG